MALKRVLVALPGGSLSLCKHRQTPHSHHNSHHSRAPSALASTLFLSFGAQCRSDARGHGLFEARLPRAVGLDRSFVRQLWRPLRAGATRPAANITSKPTEGQAPTRMRAPPPSRSRSHLGRRACVGVGVGFSPLPGAMRASWRFPWLEIITCKRERGLNSHTDVDTSPRLSLAL